MTTSRRTGCSALQGLLLRIKPPRAVVDETGSNPLAQLRALDLQDPLTPGRVATILVQLDRHKLSDADAEAIYAEVRRIRRALLKLPTLIVRPLYIGSRRSGRA